MNCLTLNSCCFGEAVKWHWVRKLQSSLKINFIGIQETQMLDYLKINVNECWNDTDFDFEGVNASGRSGGASSPFGTNSFLINRKS